MAGARGLRVDPLAAGLEGPLTLRVDLALLFLQTGFQASGSIDNLDDGDPELVYCKLLDGTHGALDKVPG